MSQLTITLLGELADKVRSLTALEGYASENAFVEEHLADAIEPDAELERWLRTVGAARYDAYDAHPEDVYTSEQVLAEIAQRRKVLRKTE